MGAYYVKQHDIAAVLEKVSRAVVGVFSVAELQERVVDLCQDIFHAESCSIFLFDQDGRNLRMRAARGYARKFLDRAPLLESPKPVVKHPATDQEKLGMTTWIALTGQSFRSNTAEEHRNHPHWRGVFDIEQFGPDKIVHNFYGVPLKIADEGVIGVLKVEGKKEDGEHSPFTDADANLLDMLATYIAIAVADARRVEKIERQSEQLAIITRALQHVVGALSEEKPMQALLDEIIATTAEVLNAEACVLFLREEGSDILIERAGEGYVEHLIGKAEYQLISRSELMEVPQKPEDRLGLTAWIAITGEPFLARNNQELRAHPHWRGHYDADHYPDGTGKQCHSFLGVPLVSADEVVGVLKVENKKIDGEYVAFNVQDREVFETLGRSIAIAVGTVREQRVKREQAITDAMYLVSNALAGRFELEVLLAEIVKVGKRILLAEACVVFLIDQDNPRRLVETKGVGYVAHLEGVAEYALIPKEQLVHRPGRDEDRVGLTAWIAITGRPFLARSNAELRDHAHWRGRYDAEHYPEGTRKQCNSLLGLPLQIGEEILGVIKVENKKVGGEYVPFEEREQHIFQILANSAAIAIRNATDFKQLQEVYQLAAIGRSAAAMAHRMGSPLQRILSAAGNLEDELRDRGAANSATLERIESIEEAVEQMSDAIQRVRKATRALQIDCRSNSIERLIRRSFLDDPALSQRFVERQIRARLVGLEQLSAAEIHCDANLVGEALSNLVDNALEAVADGGIIEIRVAMNSDTLRIDIEDDGPGVDTTRFDIHDDETPTGADDKLKLFAPFNTSKRGGLGLGLFIVRRNIEAHGGQISYLVKSGRTCFRVELPFWPLGCSKDDSIPEN